MVDHSPFKDNFAIKRDRNSEIVHDTITNVPICVPKMMLKCNPRQLHNHMIESFEDAIGEDNTVIVSESKLRDILKTSCSHVKKMTAREKLMCGCETCIIFNDMHQCLNLFRKKYVTNKQREIQAMRDGRTKLMANANLDDY